MAPPVQSGPGVRGPFALGEWGAWQEGKTRRRDVTHAPPLSHWAKVGFRRAWRFVHTPKLAPSPRRTPDRADMRSVFTCISSQQILVPGRHPLPPVHHKRVGKASISPMALWGADSLTRPLGFVAPLAASESIYRTLDCFCGTWFRRSLNGMLEPRPGHGQAALVSGRPVCVTASLKARRYCTRQSHPQDLPASMRPAPAARAPGRLPPAATAAVASQRPRSRALAPPAACQVALSCPAHTMAR